MNVNDTDSANHSGAQSQSAGSAGVTQHPAPGQGQSQDQGQGGTQAMASGTAGGMSTRSDDADAKRRAGILIPPVDVIEDVGGITLVADMPGVSKDKLDLRLETNSLTIEGELSLDIPSDMESRYAEIKHKYYQRTFALSRELDGEKAVAELTNGVLRVRIPKTQQAQPRRIHINAG